MQMMQMMQMDDEKRCSRCSRCKQKKKVRSNTIRWIAFKSIDILKVGGRDEARWGGIVLY